MGVEVDERKLALQGKNLQVAQTSSGLKTSLNPDWQSDARLRMQIEDSMNTAMFSPQQPLTPAKQRVELQRWISSVSSTSSIK